MSNTITITNGTGEIQVLHGGGTPDELQRLYRLLPPDAPLDMEGLEILFESMQALSSPPTEGVEEGDVYLDDGTNTKAGQKGFRQYVSGEWVDFGLQEVEDITVDGGEWT